MIPSLILMGSTLNHLAAVALSPLLIPAFVMLMNEIVKFVYALVDRGIFSGTLRKQEMARNFITLLINDFVFTNGLKREFRFHRRI